MTSCKFKVSVIIIAYNHANFIKKTIENILNQKINFKLEIFILDDYSTDKTREIIRDNFGKIPDIQISYNSENEGQYKSVLKILNNVQGEYLILCDGDDYWTNEHKLQTQIDFLDNNLDYIASCHDVEIISTVDKKNASEIAIKQSKGFYKYISQYTTYFGDTIEAYQILEGKTYIQGCSLVWRKFDLKPYLKYFEKSKFNLDWYFTVILVTKGKIQYINEPWAVYSDHLGGRTKNNYFQSYLSDKIVLLKSLFNFEFYNQLYFRYMIYDLISKEYYGLIVSKSSKNKTTWFLFLCSINYLRFSSLKTISFLYYVLIYRKKF